MESVERHLCGGFTNGLRSQNTYHLTRGNSGLEETVFEFSENVVQSLLA